MARTDSDRAVRLAPPVSCGRIVAVMAAGNWRRRLKLVVPGVVLLGAAALWLLSPKPTDREQVLAMIARGEHGLETKNAKEVMSCVAPDYHDSQNATYSELYRGVLQWGRVPMQGDLTIQDYRIDVGRGTGTGRFSVVFVLREKSGHEETFPMQLTMTFEKRRQGWRQVWLVKSVEGYDEGKMIEGVGNAE